MDDVEVKKFFEETFSDEYVTMFNELPVPVMKADLWRIAIIYVYGGFYYENSFLIILRKKVLIDID